MKQTGWDLETVESQPFFVLAEILDDERESDNPNNDVGQMSLVDFIKTGGVSSILEKGG